MPRPGGPACVTKFSSPVKRRATSCRLTFSSPMSFAMPSTGEGFGIVFLEAAASGLPVIAGNRDGSVDALADGALGTLIDPDDRQQLAAAIIAALESRSPSNNEDVERFASSNFAEHVDEIVRHLF